MHQTCQIKEEKVKIKRVKIANLILANRKDRTAFVESQPEDVTQALEQAKKEESKNNEYEKLSNKLRRENSSEDLEKTIEIIEPGVDKVTFNIKLKDDILSERERMIKAIKVYIRKHKRLPPTTLDYYKFVKLVGKGAFGKVTLGVHKLTGKQVAIKTIEKAYMKDDFSRKKVLQEVYILK